VELEAVQAFALVVELGSFSAAARRQGVPPSTVSRQVARLEGDLGVQLLHRTTRRIQLTEAGALLYDRVVPALEALHDAATAAADHHEAAAGLIRITAPEDLGTLFVADLVVEFCARWPDVRVEALLTSRTVDLVAEGVDLALRAGRLADSTLVARLVLRADLQLFASAEYIARRGQPATVQDLTSHDCVVFRPEGGRGQWDLEGPDGRAVVEVGGPVSGDLFSFVHAAVLAGAGIGLAPWFLFRDDLASGRAVRVLPDHAQRGNRAYLVYPSSRHLPHRVALLRDFLVERLTHLES
jgi:DNA-binding transcriptional LysR family regulator